MGGDAADEGGDAAGRLWRMEMRFTDAILDISSVDTQEIASVANLVRLWEP